MTSCCGLSPHSVQEDRHPNGIKPVQPPPQLLEALEQERACGDDSCFSSHLPIDAGSETRQPAFDSRLRNETPVSFSETSQSRPASSSSCAAGVVPTFMGYPRISYIPLGPK